jgi:hypothetical protein
MTPLRRTASSSAVASQRVSISALVRRIRLLFERDCANDSRAALLSDGRIRTTRPRFVDGGEAVISGSVGVIDRCAVSRAGDAPK